MKKIKKKRRNSSLISSIIEEKQDFSTEIFIFHLKSHCSNSTNVLKNKCVKKKEVNSMPKKLMTSSFASKLGTIGFLI
ncbi:hypothetical protein BpHYR1_029858 [Brachionus plicatilis]|uniref:Uncharacterized protein n=1 Tax=Brachionus plicatilis TaxID=10195 RepID=A0A3M7PFH6_BRAPC|nr:hypothetical protein BpHYR1_029858 [Brachionus plicatilis]